MIPDVEIRHVARRLGIEPRIVDLDYTLGWALWGLCQEPYLTQRLLFKGGTCLRKCYFSGYRFSEDLDFTATEWFARDEFEAAVLEAFKRAEEVSGIDFRAQPHRVETIDDEYGRESLRIHVYFVGAHPRPNSRSIRLDITRHESVVFAPRLRPVTHDYSDAEEADGWEWNCYALEEVLVEKLRAVLVQRKYAISRDLYDLHTLSREVLDLDSVKTALPAKVEARDLDLRRITTERMLSRREEFEDDWRRNLVPLVPQAEALDFSRVWDETAAFVCLFTPLDPVS